MYNKNAIVTNTIGLHSSYATFFIQKASEFHSIIHIQVNGKKRSAKSLLDVLSLGIYGGNEITIIAEGIDEKEAVDALVAILKTFKDKKSL